jgi:hypothetical protein
MPTTERYYASRAYRRYPADPRAPARRAVLAAPVLAVGVAAVLFLHSVPADGSGLPDGGRCACRICWPFVTATATRSRRMVHAGGGCGGWYGGGLFGFLAAPR